MWCIIGTGLVDGVALLWPSKEPSQLMAPVLSGSVPADGARVAGRGGCLYEESEESVVDMNSEPGIRW